MHHLQLWLNHGLGVQVTFVGDGPELEQARQEAKRLQLGSAAIFLGARTDVPNVLKNQDVFLLLSNWEGFPISIIEAMRAGLPVVASDVGGVKEAVVDKETGFLIDREERNLDDAIYKISGNHELLMQMGTNGRREFLRLHTVDQMIQKLISVYCTTMNEQPDV